MNNMVSIAKTVRRWERGIDSRAEKFVWKHPVLGFLSVFVGMPLLILACVCLSTVMIVFPMAWVLEWIRLLQVFLP